MYVIITASPNIDGLTAACGKSAYEGITGAGGQAEVISLCETDLGFCAMCGNGWGTCRESGKCFKNDVLSELQIKIREAEGVVLVTPVYFGQPSERMKSFLDRFRRCEAFNKDGCGAKGKQIDLIAAAGGSGNGTSSCLTEMESWCRYVGAVPKDRIGITRFNREPMLRNIKDGAARLVKGEYFKGW